MLQRKEMRKSWQESCPFKKYILPEEYKLPEGYNVDKIIALHVNKKRLFIYWEITDSLLETEKIAIDSGNLAIRVSITDGKNEREIQSFQVTKKTGTRYIEYHTDFIPLKAVLTDILNNKPLLSFIETEKKQIRHGKASLVTQDRELWLTKNDKSSDIESIAMEKSIKDRVLNRKRGVSGSVGYR